MGQKVNPISNRLGVIRGWDSNWSEKGKYPANILEDYKLREYLNVRLAKCSVSRVVIERTLKMITITVCTSRPGLIIGQGGKDVEALKKELSKITDKDVQINVHEVKRPELDAQIVASTIARQVEGKVAYRRAVKMAIASTMRAGAEGIKIQISGRLNGAEIARSEMFKEGRTPLHTLRADIDWCSRCESMDLPWRSVRKTRPRPQLHRHPEGRPSRISRRSPSRWFPSRCQKQSLNLNPCLNNNVST